MATVDIKLHPLAQVKFKPLDQLVPTSIAQQLQAFATPAEANGHQVKLFGFQFEDADGEIHVYVLSDEARTALIRQMTGGLVVPSG